VLTGPTAIYQVASRLVTAISDALAATAAGRPERACVTEGAVAWDACECGMLAVALERTYLSADFPAEAGVGQCDPPLIAADLTIQVARCAAAVADDELATPSCTALDASAQTVMTDAHVVATVAACTLAELEQTFEIVAYQVRPTLVVGPAGACVGSATRVTVGVNYSR